MSKKLANLGKGMQSSIDSMVTSDCAKSFLLQVMIHKIRNRTFTLNKLWRLINSLQIVLLLPLMNIKFQGNAELVYNFLDTNTNMYFQCGSNPQNGQQQGFFIFSDPIPYADQFNQQGYSSMIIFQNIGSTVSNLGNVLLAIVCAAVLLITIQAMGVKHKLFEIARRMAVCNYILQQIVQNGLRLQTFALINLIIMGQDSITDPNLGTSIIVSWVFIGVLVVTMIVNLIFVKRTPVLSVAKDQYSYVEYLFVGLHNTFYAKLFWAIFIARRFILAFTCVYLKDYQGLQIICLLIQSQVMLCYVVTTMPFESRVENFLLVFNESVIITAILHMISFSDANSTVPIAMKYNVGWSYTFLILAQIITNLLLYAGEILYKIGAFLRQQWLKRQMNKKRMLHSLTKISVNQLESSSTNAQMKSVLGSMWNQEYVKKAKMAQIKNMASEKAPWTKQIQGGMNFQHKVDDMMRQEAVRNNQNFHTSSQGILNGHNFSFSLPNTQQVPNKKTNVGVESPQSANCSVQQTFYGPVGSSNSPEQRVGNRRLPLGLRGIEPHVTEVGGYKQSKNGIGSRVYQNYTGDQTRQQSFVSEKRPNINGLVKNNNDYWDDIILGRPRRNSETIKFL